MTSDLITPWEAADPSHRGLQMDLKDSQAVFRMKSGLISAFQNHPRHPLVCTHLEVVHNAHCALCAWQDDALHTVCSHLHFCLHLALCTMHYALGYYALCTVLAPCTCTCICSMHHVLCTMHRTCTLHMHSALCTVHCTCTLHFLSPADPGFMRSGWNREKRERERGRGKKCHEELLMYNTREDKSWFPVYISQT